MAAVLVVSMRIGLTRAVVLTLEAVVLASEAAVCGYWAVAASEANTTASEVSTTALSCHFAHSQLTLLPLHSDHNIFNSNMCDIYHKHYNRTFLSIPLFVYLFNYQNSS